MFTDDARQASGWTGTDVVGGAEYRHRGHVQCGSDVHAPGVIRQIYLACRREFDEFTERCLARKVMDGDTALTNIFGDAFAQGSLVFGAEERRGLP